MNAISILSSSPLNGHILASMSLAMTTLEQHIFIFQHFYHIWKGTLRISKRYIKNVIKIVCNLRISSDVFQVWLGQHVGRWCTLHTGQRNACTIGPRQGLSDKYSMERVVRISMDWGRAKNITR